MHASVISMAFAPPHVFRKLLRLDFRVTKKIRRAVWAYVELQHRAFMPGDILTAVGCMYSQ